VGAIKQGDVVAIGAREYEEAKKALKEALRLTNRVELHDIA
jgi:hypothetical protein